MLDEIESVRSMHKKRSPKREEDDAVLVDDNSSQDSEKRVKNKLGSGQPDVVFFNDPNAIDTLRKIKEQHS